MKIRTSIRLAKIDKFDMNQCWLTCEEMSTMREGKSGKVDIPS